MPDRMGGGTGYPPSTDSLDFRTLNTQGYAYAKIEYIILKNRILRKLGYICSGFGPKYVSK